MFVDLLITTWVRVMDHRCPIRCYDP